MFVLFLPLSGPAQTNVVRPLTLQECIQVALEHNLDIRIERLSPLIARQRVRLAWSAYEPLFESAGTHGFRESPGGVDDENRRFPGTTTRREDVRANVSGALPTGLTYDLGGRVTDTYGKGESGPFESSDGVASIELRQPLLRNLWTDANRLAIQANRKLLKISEEEFRRQVMIIVTAVRIAYFDLKVAQENARVQQAAYALAAQLLAANRERVAAGTVAPLDEKQAESQVASQQADLLVAERFLSVQQNVLKQLLSDNLHEWQDVAIEPIDELTTPAGTFSRAESWKLGMEHRPELQQARLELERLGFVLKYRRNQLFPQLDLVGSYGYNGSGSEVSGALGGLQKRDSSFYSYGLVLSVPLGNRAARSIYQITKAENQQALLRLQQLEQAVLLDIEDAVTLAQTTHERVALTRQARVFAEQALEANQVMFENGKTTSFFVLQFQRDLTTARLREVQALAEYNRALANLALREGTVLQRNNLTLDLK